MSYTIYHSNDLIQFIKNNRNLFHGANLFGEKVITVVQNRNIASWLKLELTKFDGISMDLQVEYPENAVKQLVLGYKTGQELFKNENDDGLKSILFMDSLKIVVYKTLEKLLVNRNSYPNLYDYVQNSSQRLFQLSDSIAGLFYHYGMNCPQMVASWDKKELYTNNKGQILRQEEQKWQMSLWNDIFNSNTPYLHISNVLNSVLNSGDSYDPGISPFGKCRIILFGSSFLGESAIKFFNYLSRDIEVHHFILTPSKIYAADEEVKPVSILERFSGLINGFTSISRENGFSKTRVNNFTEIKPNSLLNSLKVGIRDNSLTDDKNENPLPLIKNDSSLKICRVTGGWREIEILKDKILNLLDNNRNLKLTDIGVVAPDISIYSSYIEGLFPEVKKQEDGSPIFGKNHLPYNIMGLKGGEDSPYIRGIISLLDLPGTVFSRKDIINLISNPCFMEKFRITNNTRDLFLETIEQLNIKWAVDGKHRKDLGYKDEDFNTWESGFKRYLLGIALNREDHNSIPYNLSDSQGTDSIGELVHIVRSLYSDLWDLNKLSLKMDEWVFLIETIMETYLSPVKDDLFDERERLSVKHQYRNILNLLDDLKQLSNFEKQEVPFPVFRSLLKEFIVKSGNSKGRYLTQGITFSSLKPLRAVPFKHIFILGLNEDVFPGKEKVPSYDLRGIYEQKIDLSKRQNDKFAFLELILSASESLTLFYNSKNQISGEELQPSVVISELLEIIEVNFDNSNDLIKDIIEDHPLHNFDASYFKKNSNLKSYNQRAYESAIAYSGDKTDPVGLLLNEEESVDQDLEITVNDLIQFIKNPVKTFFNKGEGIYLDRAESIEEKIYENRDLDFLLKWKLTNVVMEMGLNDDISLLPLSDSFFQTAEIEGVFKDSKLTSNIKKDVEELILDIDLFLKEKQLKGTSFNRVNRELSGEFTPLKFSVNGKNVLLTGELENLWVDDNRSCFLTNISLGKNKEMKPKDKILPYIYSLVIFSHPEMEEKEICAFSVGREIIEPATFELNESAKEILNDIVSLYVKNLTQPIPIYPDIMENPEIQEIKKSWEKSVNDTMFFSLLNECPYVKMAYNQEIPEFRQEDVDLMYNSLYKEINNKKVKK